jgi:citrate lyase subunit beta/citryl-CoA lyase
MRLRALLATNPDPERVDAALETAADALVFSLAGATAGPGSRSAVRDALPRVRERGKAAIVTVNHPRTRLLRDDLDAVVCEHLSAVILPHATEPQDVRDIAVGLREFEHARGIEPGTIAVIPVIGSARGLLRAADIARAVPRVAGLLFDAAAYARDIGGRDEDEGHRFAYARGAVVAAAVAAGALPLAASSGFGLLQLAHTGFAGALLPDARALASALAAFTPPAHAVERARAVRAAYAAARAEGAWVARLGGDVIDAPAARAAARLLEQAGEPADPPSS